MPTKLSAAQQQSSFSYPALQASSQSQLIFTSAKTDRYPQFY
jgi:hypothetical protein